MKNDPIRMRAARESFLLLNPNSKKSSHEVAKEIAACRGVRKVFITSGEFGFVVSTAEEKSADIEDVSRRVRKSIGIGKAKAVKSHYVYTKTR